MKGSMEGPKKFLKQFAIATGITAGVLLNTNTSEAQISNSNKKQEFSIDSTYTKEQKDQNMPDGFRREQVFATVNGQEQVIASMFWFDDKKTKTCFISNDEHLDVFTPNINYEKVDSLVEKKGVENVISFVGAYTAPSGNIEGVAIENGKQVGEQNFSKWAGLVYITPTGIIELYRCKDANNNFDKNMADSLVGKAEKENASLFQQIPAIWGGKQMLNSSKQEEFEFRAICQTKDEKKFILNCTEKVTLDKFLKMALNLKDSSGQSLVDDLMLVDTGIYSYGIFKDKDDKTYKMIDEQYSTSTKNYTNIISIGTKIF